ncbi:MAG: glycerophosphodiester phosphodiesterase family protein [Bacteroidetes bacterium]|nr:glycerophosphodiester phosphodiesterase family protein [Bacteroidota bacterium]
MRSVLIKTLILFILLFQFSCSSWKAKTSDLQALQKQLTWSADRKLWVSAHRGGPSPGFAENCIPTFEKTSKLGLLMIECDVRVSKDSVLVFSHDEEMGRTHSISTGKVSDYSLNELRKVKLKDDAGNLTESGIPTLDEVLEWAKGKALLTLDVKRGVPFKMVTDKIKEHQAEGYALFITYSVEDAKKVHLLHPGVMISVVIQNLEEWKKFRESGIPTNLVTAFVGIKEPEPALYDSLHANKILAALGVFNEDKLAEQGGDTVYTGFFKRGADILATDRPEAVMRVITGYK